MKAPEIIRSNKAHVVEMAEGSKDASRRHGALHPAIAEQRTPLLRTDLRTSTENVRSPALDPQLSPSAADSSYAWFGDDDLASRVEQLKRRNQKLKQGLERMNHSGPGEDTHE